MAASMRVAFSMTIDPEGAMHDWVDVPDLIRVPTQELVPLFGPRGYQRLLVDLCERERPEVLVTHPPYDWLDPATADEIRKAGTRIVGYAFDDEIFAGEYTAEVRAQIERIYDRYVTTREVRWATRPLPALAERDAEFDVALVGSKYARREELVAALRGAGLRVETRGIGWPEGFMSRRGMLDLYARAAVVLTTADWESRAVPMVKHRLLDAAMLGAFQIAQDAPDLRGYFSDDEVPSYREADELIARVHEALADPVRRRSRALAARQRALAEHTWTVRFPELVSGVATVVAERRERSDFFTTALTALATRAEAEQRISAATALWREVADRDPDAAAGGLGRCLRDLGRPEEAIDWLRRAAQLDIATCAGAIHGKLPGGPGLGRLGLLPPNAEPTIWWIACLVELDRIAEAAGVIDGLDGVLGRAVASTLSFGDRPELEPVRAALSRARERGA